MTNMDLRDDQQIAELTAFFHGIKNLPRDLQLIPGTRIIDLPKFIDTHLTLLKPGNSPAIQAPALERILKLKELLSDASQRH
jgi:hypothetical protein